MFSRRLEILQAAPVLLNLYPSEAKKMNIQYFYIWVPWHAIDSLYFPNNFWQISQCGLPRCFDIHFMTAFEKHIKIRTAAGCSLELQTSERDPQNYCVHWRVQYTVFSIQNAEY